MCAARYFFNHVFIATEPLNITYGYYKLVYRLYISKLKLKNKQIYIYIVYLTFSLHNIVLLLFIYCSLKNSFSKFNFMFN